METQVPHVNIVICTPGLNFTQHYMRSLLETLPVLGKAGLSFSFANEFCSHVSDARETTLNGSKDGNNFSDSRPFKGQLTYDKLMWIDSDIGWSPADFMSLYGADEDIISGAYLLGNGAVAAHKLENRNAYTLDEVKELKEKVKIASAGFGFMAVKKGVFESLSRPWFQSAQAEVTLGNGQQHSFNIMGEDVSWCVRAKEAGFDVWLDPNVKLIHQKQYLLTWEGLIYT